MVSTHVPVDLLGVIVGLGIVISFSYWCTDFLLMQRALAARTVEAARRVPLYAGFGKLLFSFLVVLPVLIAGRTINGSGAGALDQTFFRSASSH
jgi:SSS family solute:Na+ symporter